MGNLFSELKRRNLFRIATLYLVGGWIILQVADVLFGLLGVPGWSLRLVAALLALGFPVALVFAWVYEMTPEGLKPAQVVPPEQSITSTTGRKLNTVITVTLVVAVLLLIGDRVLQRDSNTVPASAGSVSSETVAQPASSSDVPPKQSVAVLPFVDMSPAKDQEYFTDGLTENLLNGLAQVPGLQVAGRTSSFAFKGKNEDLRSVGEQLGVANILEGSVQKSGERIRITAQLVNADNGYHLWSQTFDRTLEDIFAVQDEIAAEVTKALKVALLGAEAQAAESHAAAPNSGAYTEYLKGRYAFKRNTLEGALEAIDHYQQALKLDPAMAPAWAGLAKATAWHTSYSSDFSEGYERARKSAVKALELDDSLPEAYLALAEIQISYDWNWSGAEASLNHALSLRPGDANILQDLAHLENLVGRYEEGYRHLQKAAVLDPLDWSIQISLANSHFRQERYDQALEILYRVREMDPGRAGIHYRIGRTLLATGRNEEALAEFRLEKLEFLALQGEAVVLGRLGKPGEAQATLDKLIKGTGESSSYQIAQVYAQRGDLDSAMDWLERGYAIRDPGLTYLKADNTLDPLRDDPRFQALMEKMHLAD
ncbi:MAG: tetratricopeptide repeat protein [Gammaproteobacteria bacterium]|nr:tetratricopeptide repeat protein [Gammaproteobacteria bacterium]